MVQPVNTRGSSGPTIGAMQGFWSVLCCHGRKGYVPDCGSGTPWERRRPRLPALFLVGPRVGDGRRCRAGRRASCAPLRRRCTGFPENGCPAGHARAVPPAGRPGRRTGRADRRAPRTAARTPAGAPGQQPATADRKRDQFCADAPAAPSATRVAPAPRRRSRTTIPPLALEGDRGRLGDGDQVQRRRRPIRRSAAAGAHPPGGLRARAAARVAQPRALPEREPGQISSGPGSRPPAPERARACRGRARRCRWRR